jgi:TonB family protein
MSCSRGATRILVALAVAGVSQAAAQTPVRAVADVEKPKEVEHVDPVYPAEAKAAGVEGVVVVGFTVDVEGRVTEPVVLSGHVLLGDAALAAVRRWRYRPTLVNGKAVPVRMVETVPFWLDQAARPPGWPMGSVEAGEKWITWPRGKAAQLKLLALEAEELPPPSTLRVYRGTVTNLSKKPLRSVLATAVFRESLNAPVKALAVELGDLAPHEERRFELRPEGHQVDVVFGQIVDGDARPLPTLRQIKSMTRVLPCRPIHHERTEACLEPRGPADPAADARSPSSSDDSGGSAPTTDYDRPPKPRKITKPDYSKPAFDARVEGTVLVEILIDASGYVDCARVLTSMPGTGFDAEALKTTYEWSFEPAVKDGRPVATIAHAPVTFRIY